jgi:tetratricopeptide (TPR) repeat protein
MAQMRRLDARLGLAGLCLLAGGCASTQKPPEPEALPPEITLSNRPDAAAAAVGRARALASEGLERSALAEFERAIAINPELTPAYIGAGRIHASRGAHTLAERRFRRATELEPRSFDAQFGLAASLNALGRLTEAVGAYLRAVSLQPNDFGANLGLSGAYLALGEPGQALPYARRAVRLDPESGPARVNLGSAYAAAGRHGEAVLEYQQAAELMTLTPELLLSLADSLGRSDRHEESAATLRQLLRSDPSAAAHERLGAAQFRLRAYGDAEASFRAALELDSDYYPAMNGLAVCRLNAYLWSDRADRAALEEARTLMRRSLRLERRQPQIVELLTRYR